MLVDHAVQDGLRGLARGIRWRRWDDVATRSAQSRRVAWLRTGRLAGADGARAGLAAFLELSLHADLPSESRADDTVVEFRSLAKSGGWRPPVPAMAAATPGAPAVPGWRRARRRSPTRRCRARSADPPAEPLAALVAQPVLVDALFVTWLGQGAGDTAWQLFAMDLEMLALNLALTGVVKQVADRERPSGTACRTDPRYDRRCEEQSTRGSFFSGHTPLAFTAASLTCWGYGPLVTGAGRIQISPVRPAVLVDGGDNYPVRGGARPANVGPHHGGTLDNRPAVARI